MFKSYRVNVPKSRVAIIQMLKSIYPQTYLQALPMHYYLFDMCVISVAAPRGGLGGTRPPHLSPRSIF